MTVYQQTECRLKTIGGGQRHWFQKKVLTSLIDECFKEVVFSKIKDGDKITAHINAVGSCILPGRQNSFRWHPVAMISESSPIIFATVNFEEKKCSHFKEKSLNGMGKGSDGQIETGVQQPRKSASTR